MHFMTDEDDDRKGAPVDPDEARGRQRVIGRRLQSFFDDVVKEGVPDDFQKLLDDLERSEAERKTDGEARSNEADTSEDDDREDRS